MSVADVDAASEADLAIAAAERDGVSPDTHYCMSLLETTGICTVPGSGFGQAHGTYHLRMTFLTPAERQNAAIDRFADHHRGYLHRYG